MIAGFLVFAHRFQAPQFLEPVIYQGPDAVLVDVDFAFAVVGSSAGAVDQALVAVGHRADAAGLPDDAGAALGTDFVKCAIGCLLADKHRVQRRNHHFFQLAGNGLNKSESVTPLYRKW